MAAKKTSKSGYYRVKLHTKFPHADFMYLPGHDAIVVDQALYEEMDAAGVVEDVQPA